MSDIFPAWASTLADAQNDILSTRIHLAHEQVKGLALQVGQVSSGILPLIQIGPNPGTASAINVDASLLPLGVLATFTNGTGVSIIRQAANAGMILGTVSSGVLTLQSNNQQKWSVQGVSGNSDFVPAQATARIFCGTSGLTFRDNASTQNNMILSNTGNLTVLGQFACNGAAPAAPPASGGTVGGVITGLVAIGLFAS